METANIGFLGAGSMTEAMIEGMISQGFANPKKLMIMNRSNSQRLDELEDKYSVQTTQNTEELLKRSNILILAMKPLDASSALENIQPFITHNHLIISVLAGITTSYVEELIGMRIPIVRAMPNTSAAIGFSATAIAPGEFATKKHLSFAERLFDTIGTVVHVEEEKLDAVTGVSGSGPAYFYYMVECMEKAAILNGLDEETARSLIIQTIHGAAKMLNRTDKQASLLREQVTSPGGTTQAGLSILEEYRYEEAVSACITAARKRSEELGKIFEKQKE
ncbi:MAG: pyrroline-5-carboxylate reductase [Anaerobacillus sp.]